MTKYEPRSLLLAPPTPVFFFSLSTFLSDRRPIPKGPRMGRLLKSSPGHPPKLGLSHVCSTTSPEATNTDVLISILLHRLFTLPTTLLLLFHTEGGEGVWVGGWVEGRGRGSRDCSPACSAEFKTRSVRDGARCRGEVQPCG